jgi:hypothetical protein
LRHGLLGDLAGTLRTLGYRYPHRQPIHRADTLLLEQVPVEIGRDLNACVPELLADVFDALALINQDACVGVQYESVGITLSAQFLRAR